MTDTNLVSFTVNGQEVEGPAGANLLKWCNENGFKVPFYCFHPGLTVAANCRMCLVKTSTSRKPEPSCNMVIQEGMAIETDSDEVKSMQQDVMEFLLINHPLDCPTCDQAGECELQDYSFEYGHSGSRFIEDKNTRDTKMFGPLVKYYGDRCISCTRCIRFCDEISGTGELSLTERGGHYQVDIFPGVEMDNPLSGNTIDICPVGALLSSDFLFQARVWFLNTTETVCTTCARGCNIYAEDLKGNLKRLRPRDNADVNEYWMCDPGRLNFKYVQSVDRLVQYRWPEGPETARETMISRGRRLKDLLAPYVGKIAVLVSPYMTNEELYLVKKLCADALQPVAIGVLNGETWERQEFPGGFVIEADKTPNAAGVRAVFGDDAGDQASAVNAVSGGSATAILVFRSAPPRENDEVLATAVKSASFSVVFDIMDTPVSEGASVAVPSSAFIEHDGTIVNSDGRVQRLRRGIDGPGQVDEGHVILQNLLMAFGAWETQLSAEGVFRALAADNDQFGGLDYGTVGTGGVVLGSSIPVAAGEASEATE
jgi:NADH-quinone oxidoreductase subunit G